MKATFSNSHDVIVVLLGIVFHLNHMAVHQGVVPKSMMEKKPLPNFIKTKRWYPENSNFQVILLFSFCFFFVANTVELISIKEK